MPLLFDSWWESLISAKMFDFFRKSEQKRVECAGEARKPLYSSSSCCRNGRERKKEVFKMGWPMFLKYQNIDRFFQNID